MGSNPTPRTFEVYPLQYHKGLEQIINYSLHLLRWDQGWLDLRGKTKYCSGYSDRGLDDILDEEGFKKSLEKQTDKKLFNAASRLSEKLRLF